MVKILCPNSQIFVLQKLSLMMGVYEVFIGILAYLLHKIITVPMLYHPVTSCNIRQGSKNSFMIISMLLVKLPVRILATSVVVAY